MMNAQTRIGLVTLNPGMSVVVTGGTGFLGTQVSKQLLDLQCRVTAVDDLSIGNVVDGELTSHPSFTFTKCDLSVRDDAIRAIAEPEPELVIHLAALHFIPSCVANPYRTLEVNVLATQNVLDACAHLETSPGFVLASTADVYVPDLSAHHEDSLVGPDNIYGVSKLTDEALVRIAAGRGHCRFLVCRLFNLYGPGETNPHVIPEIVTQLQQGDTVRLGNTSPRRDFVYVDDAATAIIRLAQLAPVGATVNVGTGTSHSIDEVLDMISRHLGRPITVEVDHERWRQSDRPNLQCDSSRLRSFLPDALDTSMQEGLSRLLSAEGLR